MKESYWIFWVTWDDFNDFRLKLYFKSWGKQDFLNPKYRILIEKQAQTHIYLQAFSSSWSILSDPTFLYLKKNIRVFFYIKRIPGLQSLFSTYSGFFKASRCRALLEEWAGWRGVTLSPSKNSRCPHQKGMFLKSTEGGDILVVRAGSDFSEDWRKEFSIERNCLRRVGFVLDLEFFGKATTLRFASNPWNAGLVL